MTCPPCTCPPCKKPGEHGNKKRERMMIIKTNPVHSYKGKKEDSRTNISASDRCRLRITRVNSGGRVGIRNNRVRHEELRGSVQSLNGISVAPVVVSGVGEAIGLENLHRRDTTFDKEVTKESSDGSERVLFIGTQFSIQYTFMYSPADAATPRA